MKNIRQKRPHDVIRLVVPWFRKEKMNFILLFLVSASCLWAVISTKLLLMPSSYLSETSGNMQEKPKSILVSKGKQTASFTTKEDGLMVLAFFYEKIIPNLQTMTVSQARLSYENEGDVLYNGINISMFDAIRASRHAVNPLLDSTNKGIWSYMEWDNVLHYQIIKNLTNLTAIQTPLKLEDGGLGWYNNLDFDVRKKQGALARQHGVDGFIFYTNIDQKLSASTRSIVDARVQDGEPAGAFAVMAVDVKDTGGTVNLIAFGEWLRNITSHSDYIRVNGKPVVYLYKPQLFLADGDTTLRRESIKRGLSIVEEAAKSPIYWIGTYSNLCLRGVTEEEKKVLDKVLDAWSDFAPHRGSCMNIKPPEVPPWIRILYETFLSGWYPAPRGLTWFDSKHKAGWRENSYRAPLECNPKNSPARFYEIMKEGLIRTLCRKESNMDGRLENGHIWRPVSIFAWNEWGEQAVLEPSTLNGFSYLQNLHQARQDAMEMNCTLYLQQNTAF
jgi:hypothetical protein